MSEDELFRMYNILVKARSSIDIFGSPLIFENVNERYKSTIKIIHPDHYNNNVKLKYIAEESTKILNSFYKEAKDILSGKNQHVNISFNKIVYDSYFKFGDAEYGIFNKFIDDNFCRVYFGKRISPNGNEDICLKISKSIDDNYLLENESKILKKVMHKSMPIFLDNFVSKNGNEINITRRINDSYDLIKIKEMYPFGLPQEHVAWIMDRLLSVIGYLHSNKVIHGGIEPSNILITPYNHNAILIDYIFAIGDATKDNVKYTGVNEFSAPELDRSIKPHPVTDMYSFGKTMEYIITDNKGGYSNSVDKRMKKFISDFLVEDPENRVDDAWECWYKLKSLRQEIFGSKNQFLPFNVKKI